MEPIATYLSPPLEKVWGPLPALTALARDLLQNSQ